MWASYFANTDWTATADDAMVSSFGVNAGGSACVTKGTTSQTLLSNAYAKLVLTSGGILELVDLSTSSNPTLWISSSDGSSGSGRGPCDSRPSGMTGWSRSPAISRRWLPRR